MLFVKTPIGKVIEINGVRICRVEHGIAVLDDAEIVKHKDDGTRFVIPKKNP